MKICLRANIDIVGYVYDEEGNLEGRRRWRGESKSSWSRRGSPRKGSKAGCSCSKGTDLSDEEARFDKRPLPDYKDIVEICHDYCLIHCDRVEFSLQLDCVPGLLLRSFVAANRLYLLIGTQRPRRCTLFL
jgi:hypothetical protein